MFKFNAVPWYTPKADLVVCLGDMDNDKPLVDGIPYYYFEEATAVFHNNKIPFITITGNHDIHCDYFNDGSKGMTTGEPSTGLWTSNGGGQYSTEQSLKLIKTIYDNAASDGGFEVELIESSTDAENEPGHFTFTYKGVRFYCANTYWWQKPWDSPSVGGAKYYSAKSTLDNLDTFVTSHSNEASIWLSHFPFRAAGWRLEDASERWWLDQNFQGTDGVDSKSILPSSYEKEYYTSNSFTTDEGKAIANNKKAYLADIVVKSKNPVHVSGHTHINHILDVTATNGAKFTDYTTQPITETGKSNGYDGNAFVVLCKAGVGVVDVIRTTF
jgi:predicted phosphodiesterase